MLGALSMLLNGGGVAQIRTIASRAQQGARRQRAGDPRAARRPRHARRRARRPQVGDHPCARRDQPARHHAARPQGPDRPPRWTDLSPGLRELEDQRGKLVDMLQALDRLSGVATDVINRSRDDVVADLELLRPILAKLVESGADLLNSLELLPTLPVHRRRDRRHRRSDYANLYISADLDLATVLDEPRRSAAQTAVGLPPTRSCSVRCWARPLRALPEFPLLDEGGPPAAAGTGPAAAHVRLAGADRYPGPRAGRRWWPVRTACSEATGDHQGRTVAAGRVPAGHGGRGRATRASATRGSATLFGTTTYPVRMQLADSGGIFTGADVTYRGRERRAGSAR